MAAFRKWGVPFVEHDGPGWDDHGSGWRSHNRAVTGRPWGPVNGVMLHHTGDDAADSVDLALLWNGRSGLPGPLCHWGMDDEGVAHFVGCGRANHAGGGDPKVLSAVVAESYGDSPPAPHEHEGSDGSVDGNVHFYGQETMYSGGHGMTPVAYRSTVLAFAAVCDAHGWTARSCIGHREWSDWKSDPGHLDMTAFRKDVQAALDAGPSATVVIAGRGMSAPIHVPAPVPAPQPARYFVTHVLYARRGTPDHGAAAWFLDAAGRDDVALVVTADAARAAHAAGAHVIAVGGPACADVASLSGVTPVNGANAIATGRQLAGLALDAPEG